MYPFVVVICFKRVSMAKRMTVLKEPVYDIPVPDIDIIGIVNALDPIDFLFPVVKDVVCGNISAIAVV
jgi:hypothetical protein